MSLQGWAQIAAFVAIVTALTPPVGAYIMRVFRGDRLMLSPLLAPVERAVYRLLRVDPTAPQNWKEYARSAVMFSVVSWIALYLILRTQDLHPFNPEGFSSGTWDLSFNTTSSWISNTSWQFYAGETTLSYFSQMAGIAAQSFLSGAVGLAVAIAVIRGFENRPATTSLGNFWFDLTRGMLYVLLPISFVAALLLASQGVIQTLASYASFLTLAGGEQTLALGPVASQEGVRHLTSLGGGFFNVNSAMPFENPNGFTNLVEMLLIIQVPAALTATFGRMVGSRRQGWAIYAAMLVLFVGSVAVLYSAETRETPAMAATGVEGVNLQDKEQRFGAANSALFTAVTTASSPGSTNTGLEGLSGLGGAVPMANMMTGEVMFGGIGCGLYGMLLMALLAVFLAGLMVGRTPEYLGKKIREREVKLVMLGTLAVPMAVLTTTALAVAMKWGAPSILNSGPQGFSETLYAYASQGFNNGSAFAGYTGYVQPNAPGNVGAFGITFAQLLGGVVMLLGRFVPMLVVLAVAGALAGQRPSLPSAGTLRTTTPTFVALLVGVVLMLALLTFVPALMLGPLAQDLTSQLF